MSITARPKQKEQYEDTFVPDIYKCESPIERRLYNGLMHHGLHATAQQQVGKYRIDLAFPHYMLAIECDGKPYHSTPQQKAHDRKKDQYLKQNGWTVMRFQAGKYIVTCHMLYKKLTNI